MSFLSIQAQVERVLPGALSPASHLEGERVKTGNAALDIHMGGIPRSALTQFCASGRHSSGRTTVLLSIMAQLTRRGECCALIDAGDHFDPLSANASGVELRRLLWVRCGERSAMRPLEQVFKAADIVVQNGGFGLIALDLGGIDERFVRKIPLTTWFRFARVVEKLPTALVVLAPCSAAQGSASLTLQFHGAWVHPCGSSGVSHARLFNEAHFAAEATKARKHAFNLSPYTVSSSNLLPSPAARVEFSARAPWT